jgi:tRNA-splicing endonuclease subunit Sen15
MISPLDTLIAAVRAEPGDVPQLLALTVQVLHNLEYQHRWTNLKIHRTSSITGKRFPRILISGLPPKRIYLNPDEQTDILRREVQRSESTAEDSTESADQLDPEYEWVLSTHLNEEWSLDQLAQVFDVIEHVPDQSASTQWRQTKRVLMAIVQDDSSIVYYFSHDGIVKPRQN